MKTISILILFGTIWIIAEAAKKAASDENKDSGGGRKAPVRSVARLGAAQQGGITARDRMRANLHVVVRGNHVHAYGIMVRVPEVLPALRRFGFVPVDAADQNAAELHQMVANIGEVNAAMMRETDDATFDIAGEGRTQQVKNYLADRYTAGVMLSSKPEKRGGKDNMSAVPMIMGLETLTITITPTYIRIHDAQFHYQYVIKKFLPEKRVAGVDGESRMIKFEWVATPPRGGYFEVPMRHFLSAVFQQGDGLPSDVTEALILEMITEFLETDVEQEGLTMAKEYNSPTKKHGRDENDYGGGKGGGSAMAACGGGYGRGSE